VLFALAKALGAKVETRLMATAKSATGTEPGPAAPSRSRVASVETLRLRDGRMLCARKWPGSGPGTLVVLHGLLDSAEGWTCVCEQVSAGSIVFDLPGFGYSDAPARGSIDGYAGDVAEGLEMLGVESFVLLGHSLGGAIAAAVAELMPERVRALVLLAPAGFGRIHLAEAVSIPGVRNMVQAGLPLALSSRVAVTAAYMTMITSGRHPEREIVDRVTDRGGALVDGAREGTRAVAESGRSRDAFHRRRVDYDGPVTAIWGDRDRLVPVSHRRGVKVAFPHARIQIWPRMGHHAVRERFDGLLAVVHAAVTNARAVPAQPPGTAPDIQPAAFDGVAAG
jgi:pimeloyl-ACP methyl ester carboxylesterase